jgi:hypothetical protein
MQLLSECIPCIGSSSKIEEYCDDYAPSCDFYFSAFIVLCVPYWKDGSIFDLFFTILLFFCTIIFGILINLCAPFSIFSFKNKRSEGD